ncbi:MAG: dihydrolipoyllysine-residue acetyltransferase, partial [Pseudomonadota bacterium]
MAIQAVLVPDIGSFKDVEIIEVLVNVGDTIAVEDSLITIESDKSSMEIPSPVAGVIKELKVKVGDRISEGSLVVMMEVGDAVAGAAVAPQAPPSQPSPARGEGAKIASEPKSVVAPVLSPSPLAGEGLGKGGSSPDFSKAYATPSVRKFARELGADLNKVKGSGRKGRITQDDVKAYIKDVMSFGGMPSAAASGNTLGVAPMPDIDFSQWGAIETVPLSRINKLTGEFLHRNWVHIPHVTQFDQADITDLEAFR